MQDQERAAAVAGPAAEGVHQQDLVREIESRGRFVQDQQRRLLRERAGEKDALALSARKLGDRTIGEIQRVDFLERRVRALQIVRSLQGPEAEVGRAPHQGNLAGGEGEIVRRILGQERDPAGAVAAREPGHGRALQQQRAVLGRQQPAAEAREGALSGGVGPDHADHLTARHGERGPRDRLRGPCGMPVAQLAAFEQRHRRLRIKRTKSGAPTMAVTAPTGGSAPRPRKRTRARASARIRKAAPPSAEAGSTTR